MQKFTEWMSDQSIKAVDVEKSYDDMLNELYSFKDVGGPFEYMEPAKVLKEVSPTDYRVGVSEHDDYLVDSGYKRFENEIYPEKELMDLLDEYIDECDDEIAELEKDIDDLNDEISELQDELDDESTELASRHDHEKEIEFKEGEIDGIKVKIEAIKALIEEAKDSIE